MKDDPLFDEAVRAACKALGKDPDETISGYEYEDYMPAGITQMKRRELVAKACGKEIAAVIAVVRKDEAQKRKRAALEGK